MNKNFMIVIIAIASLLFVGDLLALHSPIEWYEPSPRDVNFNKLDDRLDALSSKDQPEVFICFKYDCRPDSLMSELLNLGGDLGYSSSLIASAAVRGISVSDLQNTVASWDSVGWILPIETLEPHMNTAGQSVGAHAGFYSPNTAEDQGFDGTGITIAIFDTGVKDAGNTGGHTDLPAALAGIFVTGAWTPTVNIGNPTDDQGHGTAVAGVALGRGNAGVDRGIAPNAELLDCRITLPGGGGTTSGAHMQAMIDWVTLNGPSLVPPVAVANISFGSNTEAPAANPLAASINALVASGVVVCVSAGNNDRCLTDINGNPAGIGAIAVTPDAITVGAMSDQSTLNRADDILSDFSRRGPGLGPDPKPNLSAYGAQCPHACPDGCAGPLTHTVNTTDRFGGYSGFSGTSCASPMVAGVCALILEMNPAMAPAAVKTLLMNEAEDYGTPGWDDDHGAGLLDLRNIFAAPLVNCDLSVDKVDYNPKPVDCNLPVTVTVTVKNVGPVAVTNFAVRMQYWYFSAGNPAVRYDLTTAPIPNTAGPLNPNSTRDFTGVFNLKLLTTPLSQHTCFWGIVDASCDIAAYNNERNINATIQNLNGTQCKAGGNKGKLSDTMFVPVRLAHRVGFNIPVTAVAMNPDAENWDVFMDYDGMIGNELEIDVDPSGCPVEVNLKAYAHNPLVDDSIEVYMFAYNEMHGNFGNVTVHFIARQEACRPGDADGSGAIDISDAVYIIAYIFGGGPAPMPDPVASGDADCSCAVDISDAVYLISYIFSGGLEPCSYEDWQIICGR